MKLLICASVGTVASPYLMRKHVNPYLVRFSSNSALKISSNMECKMQRNGAQHIVEIPIVQNPPSHLSIHNKKTRAPPPEARRATERGRTPRRTPPIFTRAALPAPAGTGPRGCRGPWPRQRRAKSRPRRVGTSEFHPEPSRGRRRRDGGARKASPRRRPRPAARAAGPWPKRGRPAPSSAHALRGSSVAARQRRA